MKTLLEERLPVYASLAWITVPTDDREPKDIADEIAARLAPGISNGISNGNGHGPAAPQP
jgi:shikimate kinase